MGKQGFQQSFAPYRTRLRRGIYVLLLLLHFWNALITASGIKPPLHSSPPAGFPILNHSQDNENASCPRVCHCYSQIVLDPVSFSQQPPEFGVNCSKRELVELPPQQLNAFTVHLDLSFNDLTSLPDHAFNQLHFLQFLNLSHNRLTSLPDNSFDRVLQLRVLKLQSNKLSGIPRGAFRRMQELRALDLEDNFISEWFNDSFIGMRNLQHVSLRFNHLQEIPNDALKHLPSLITLLLKGNQIHTIASDALKGAANLSRLDLEDNLLTEVPYGLKDLFMLEDLRLANNSITYIPDKILQNKKNLRYVNFNQNMILSIGTSAFAGMPQLQRLRLSEMTNQREFPVLNGTRSLTQLALDRGAIMSIPSYTCLELPLLQHLDVHSNKIYSLPYLKGCDQLTILNLAFNQISSLTGQPFYNMPSLQDLTLAHNNIERISSDTFSGLNKLEYLDLQDNRITYIDEQAFIHFLKLTNLNLAQNAFSVLPTYGLEFVQNLKVFGNKYLRDFPPRSAFEEVQNLALSYAYHCCQFLPDMAQSEEDQRLQEDIQFIEEQNPEKYDNLTRVWNNMANYSGHTSFADEVYNGYSDNSYLYETPTSAEENFMDEDVHVIPTPRVNCQPLPGPFMPCDDLMGWWSLRCGVWVVFLLAVIGNGVVLLISCTSHRRMDVPRLLICNLACSDFIMGIYLGFLAIVDASTLGTFKKHAIAWQTSPGCQIAGFFGVLSSELSVYTLTVITLERFYAITHAMHLNKRLSLRNAGYILSCGWALAVILALMPIFGVSDYRKFAICLPFETGDSVSLGFVCFIMLMNCIAFLIIVACYTKMYCSIRGSQAWNSYDSRIAKRMALLIFTDFACWAPISFFSLTAAFGKELISLNEAKIFTIFVLPLNSCANPFLYAIFTKQFQKDCNLLCKRLEESALNRSLSRISQQKNNNNFALSWGSSRRPSQLNSFFNDKRGSWSQSNSQGVGFASDGDGCERNSSVVCAHSRAAATRSTGRRHSDGDVEPTHSCTHSLDPRECHSAENSTEHAPCPHCEIDAHYSDIIDKIQHRTSSIFSLFHKWRRSASHSRQNVSADHVPVATAETFVPASDACRSSQGFLPLQSLKSSKGRVDIDLEERPCQKVPAYRSKSASPTPRPKSANVSSWQEQCRDQQCSPDVNSCATAARASSYIPSERESKYSAHDGKLEKSSMDYLHPSSSKICRRHIAATDENHRKSAIQSRADLSSHSKVNVKKNSSKSASNKTLHTCEQHGSYCSTSSGTSSSYNTDHHSITSTPPMDCICNGIKETHLSPVISKSQCVARSQSQLRLSESRTKLALPNGGCPGNDLPSRSSGSHQMAVCGGKSLLAQDMPSEGQTSLLSAPKRERQHRTQTTVV